MTRSVAQATWVAPSSRVSESSVSISPETPLSTCPPRPSTFGRGEKCARNSSYVASTRCSSTRQNAPCLDQVPEPEQVVLEDPAQDRPLHDRAEVRQDRREQQFAPFDDGGRPEGRTRRRNDPRPERQAAAASEDPLVPDRERVRRRPLGDRHRVDHGDAEDADGGVGLGAFADRPGRPDPDRLHLAHPLGLAGDVRRRGPDRLERRRDLDGEVDRDDGGAAGQGERAIGDDGADGRPECRRGTGSERRVHAPDDSMRTPAAAISASARSPSSGARSTARMPSRSTVVSKPRSAASRAVARTQ